MKPLPVVIPAIATAAAGLAAWGAVAAASQLFGPTVRHTSSPNRVALTFDDGPNTAVTPQLLNLLDRHSLRATFFLIGRFVRQCPGLTKEIFERGHVIGNHTDTHPNLAFQLPAGIRHQLERCSDAISAATRNEPSRWMRPPYGYRNPWLDGEVRRAGMRVVMWSMICRDWKSQPSERLIGKLARVARPERSLGDVVLLHDGDHRRQAADRQHVLDALAHWLPRWRDAGVEFVTINESA